MFLLRLIIIFFAFNFLLILLEFFIFSFFGFLERFFTFPSYLQKFLFILKMSSSLAITFPPVAKLFSKKCPYIGKSSCRFWNCPYNVKDGKNIICSYGKEDFVL